MSFKRVTSSKKCPICEHGDWCRVFDDGWVECMRIESGKPAKSGGWMHWPGQTAPVLQSSGGNRYHLTTATPAINATKLMREWVAATCTSDVVAFANSLGLRAASLIMLGVAWAAPHSAWAFPMFDGHGNTVGIRLRNERGKFAVRGSKQGIFVPEVAAQKTLFVCEGPTDTAAAVELGLFAVGRSNCCCGGSEVRDFARAAGVERVVMVSDNDKPGLDGARKVGGEIKLPFAVYVPPAKDVREFVRLGGSRAMIENTVRNTIWSD